MATIDDFKAIEMKIGTILVAEYVEGADKLLRLEVDFGEEKPRQILSGIREYYQPEQLIGKRCPFVTNLEHVGDIIDKNLMELATKKIRHRLKFSAEGFQEILARRIGENELNAIDVCRTFPTVNRRQIWALTHMWNGPGCKIFLWLNKG